MNNQKELEISDAEDLRIAIDYLIKTASKHNCFVAGFAFSKDMTNGAPLLFNFGNCTDAGNLELYTLLTRTCNKKRAVGMVLDLSSTGGN